MLLTCDSCFVVRYYKYFDNHLTNVQLNLCFFAAYLRIDQQSIHELVEYFFSVAKLGQHVVIFSLLSCGICQTLNDSHSLK